MVHETTFFIRDIAEPFMRLLIIDRSFWMRRLWIIEVEEENEKTNTREKKETGRRQLKKKIKFFYQSNTKK